MSLKMKCLSKGLRQVIPLWLFLKIRKNILRVAKVKTLLGLVTGKNVLLGDKKKVRVKLGRRVNCLQAMIRILRRYIYCHHFKSNFLLLFNYIYKINGLS